MGSDVDHVISHDTQTDPAFHSLSTFVAGPIQSVPSFEDADAAFASGAPLLRFFEPGLLLFLLPFFAFGGAARNGYLLYAQLFGCGFVGGGEEPSVGGHQIRNPVQQLLMLFD